MNSACSTIHHGALDLGPRIRRGQPPDISTRASAMMPRHARRSSSTGAARTARSSRVN
ncbi:hypothetical protein BGW80DRAFT_1239250 [Lactifluus volemus]|nr:hypothetical protein BGW80DRAFT_1239250 [Lactifluus volemus]